MKLLLEVLDYGANNSADEFTLHCAVRGGSTEAVKLLLDRGVPSLSYVDLSGCTALGLAAKLGREEIVFFTFESHSASEFN